jgi:hypothetical protein
MDEKDIFIEKFVQACFDGDDTLVASILEDIHDERINASNSRGEQFVVPLNIHFIGQTALYCAARNGHEKIVLSLLSRKVRPQ